MEGYQPAFLVLGILFPLLATGAVYLRFQSRRFARQRLETDDWLILVALIFCYAWSVNIIIDSQIGGLGAHLQFTPTGIPIPGPGWKIFQKTNYVSVVLAVPTIGLIKLSIAFLYKRIFATHIFTRVAWAVIALLVAWIISGTLVSIFPCWPLPKSWGKMMKEGHCIDTSAAYSSGVISNTIIDFIIVLVPVYNVWKLQMPLRRKIGVCLIFVLGGFVIIAGIIRMVYLIEAYNVIKHPLFYDYSYNISPAILWTIVEFNLGIICACLPLMRPVWKAYGIGERFSFLASKIGIGGSSRSRKETLPSFVRHSDGKDGSSDSASKKSQELRELESRDKVFSEDNIRLYAVETGPNGAYHTAV